MAAKKSGNRKTRTASTSRSATNPKKTAPSKKAEATPRKIAAKSKATATELPLKHTASTPAEAVQAGMAELRHRIRSRQTPAAGGTGARSGSSDAVGELDAVLARLAADYARVLGRP